ncbi:hypothetical protein KPH14_007631 [Odynerus spinipes]|uniref:Reverse transcriptase n=1 Tax=Odynerus spinipes TaxID=1348599 RepID=A0AAD9RIZ2_9HYME|nr:hypothetical protein KPH14_007631 [Odynerus spinipes]
MFREILEKNITLKIPLKSEDDIDSAVQELTQQIQNAAWRSTPEMESKAEKETNYPKYVKDKIIEKRKVRRQWQLSRHPADKAKLNRITRALKTLLYNLKNDNSQNYIKNLSAHEQGDYTLWKATRKIKQPKQHDPPIRLARGNWAREDKEKAEAFALHLASIFEPNQTAITEEEEKTISEYLETPLQLCLPIKHFSPGEIRFEIKLLNHKKAPDFDLINAKVLKELPKKAIMAITQIYNAIIRTDYFPVLWKFAKIILIHKPGKPQHEISSYRPIYCNQYFYLEPHDGLELNI